MPGTIKRSKPHRIKVNLVEATRRFLELVKEAHDVKFLLMKDSVIKNSVRRYEVLWLPLMASHHEKQPIVPPLDVYLVWMCHMLAPEAYIKDCLLLVNIIPEHSLLNMKQREAGLKKAQVMWSQTYSEEHFFPDPKLEPKEYQTRISHELVKAVKRFMTFAYQVLLPHYRDEKFLKQAVLRYGKFLGLLKESATIPLVPCHDIDLVWHVHMLHPTQYKMDMEAMVGRLVDHDEAATDNSDDFETASQNTKSAWESAYKEDYQIPGAMYRGKMIYGQLRKPLLEDEVFKFWQKKSKLSLNAIKLSNATLERSVTLVVSLVKSSESSKEIARLKVTPEYVSPDSTKSIPFSSAGDEGIHFELFDKPGVFSKKKVLMTGNYHLLQEAENLPEEGLEKGMSVTMSSEGGENTVIGGFVQVGFSITLSPPAVGPAILQLLRGEFHSAKMPENLKELWGPASHLVLPPGMSDSCILARHRLLSAGRQKRLGILILHSIPLMMSAIQVFHKDHMICISHLVGTDQLPLVEQVSGSKVPSLDRAQGSRAILIKDNRGDYAVITGVWSGYKQDVEPELSVRGHLQMTIYNLRHNTLTKMTFKGGHLKLKDISADLETGIFQISPKASEIPQKITLVLSVILLYAVCEPRSSKNADMVTVHKSTNRTSHLDPEDQDDTDALLLAVGYKEDIPSNSFLKNYVQGSGCSACWAKPAVG